MISQEKVLKGLGEDWTPDPRNPGFQFKMFSLFGGAMVIQLEKNTEGEETFYLSAFTGKWEVSQHKVLETLLVEANILTPKLNMDLEDF